MLLLPLTNPPLQSLPKRFVFLLEKKHSRPRSVRLGSGLAPQRPELLRLLAVRVSLIQQQRQQPLQERRARPALLLLSFFHHTVLKKRLRLWLGLLGQVCR